MNSLVYEAVIFDLDGTLLDTLEDLSGAVNHALEKASLPEVSLYDVRDYIGSGVRNLMMKSVYGTEFTKRYGDIAAVEDIRKEELETGGRIFTAPDGTRFFLPVERERFEEILREFRLWYSSHSMVRTRAYEGVDFLLKKLERSGCMTAVVSNKFDEAVEHLCRHYFPSIPVTIGMQEGLQKKPAPDMILKACELLGCHRSRSIYAGDSETDIEAASRSGMDVISCLWGFRNRDFLRKAGAQCFAETPEEILQIVQNGMSGFRV